MRIDWLGPMVGDQIDLKRTTHLIKNNNFP